MTHIREYEWIWCTTNLLGSNVSLNRPGSAILLERFDFLGIEFRHNYSKSSLLSCDCLKIDRKVPIGISLRGAGTITVSTGLPDFLNFMWLPFWEIKRKPFLRRTLMMSWEEKSLGMAQLLSYNSRPLYLLKLSRRTIFKIEFQCFLQVIKCLFGGFPETGHVHIQ